MTNNKLLNILISKAATKYASNKKIGIQEIKHLRGTTLLYHAFIAGADFWEKELGLRIDNEYSVQDMRRCWDAALAHALKLEGCKGSFEEFMESYKKQNDE